LCQGDIIREIPHINLKPPLPLTVIRKEHVKYGIKFAPYGYGSSAPEGGFHFDQGEQVLASCQLAFGMVLSHGCEIDKDSRYRMIALIRPLSVAPSDGQEIIRANNDLSSCYLPAYGEIMGESYVDFRRITTLHPDFLRDAERIVSLTDDAMKYIQAQFFRYFTRLDVSSEALDQLPKLL
jgi:hypothetical protein